MSTNPIPRLRGHRLLVVLGAFIMAAASCASTDAGGSQQSVSNDETSTSVPTDSAGENDVNADIESGGSDNSELESATPNHEADATPDDPEDGSQQPSTTEASATSDLGDASGVITFAREDGSSFELGQGTAYRAWCGGPGTNVGEFTIDMLAADASVIDPLARLFALGEPVTPEFQASVEEFWFFQLTISSDLPLTLELSAFPTGDFFFALDRENETVTTRGQSSGSMTVTAARCVEGEATGSLSFSIDGVLISEFSDGESLTVTGTIDVTTQQIVLP